MSGPSINLHGVPRPVQELLLWRDPKKSVIVLGSAIVAWFFLGSSFSPLTGMQLLSLIVLVAVPAFWAWNFAAPFLKRQGPPIPEFCQEGMTKADLDAIAEPALKVINPILSIVGKLMSGEDLKLSGLVAAGAFLGLKVFGRISVATLFIIVTLLAFSLPKVYEAKKNDIDKLSNIISSKAKELYAEVDKVVFKKVPKPAAKTE